MLKSRPIVAFVATTDPKRAKAFYAKTLGLHLVSEDGFALAFDAGGTMLRVAIVDTLQPAGYTVLGWIVPDIAKAVRALVRRACRVVHRSRGQHAVVNGAQTADEQSSSPSVRVVASPGRTSTRPPRYWRRTIWNASRHADSRSQVGEPAGRVRPRHCRKKLLPLELA